MTAIEAVIEALGRRPRLWSLGCGAGGDSVGYARAGRDVTGVDIKPQPRYPFEFVQADAFRVLRGLASGDQLAPDAIHASPVCKRYSRATLHRNRENHPDQIAPLRTLLNSTGIPWVMENVPLAPLRPDFKLCGCMFGLDELERERWFELGGWSAFELRPPCYHTKPIVTVVGRGRSRTGAPGTGLVADWRRAMGIDWMTRDQLAQAVPPAYTEYLGGLLLRWLLERCRPGTHEIRAPPARAG